MKPTLIRDRKKREVTTQQTKLQYAVPYELQLDLACDVGLKISPRQLFRFKINHLRRFLVPFYSLPPFLYGTDSTMDKMVTGDLESQDSNDGGANDSSLVATTILHPMVRDLAFSASNKAQNRVLKQAAAFNATIHTVHTASTQ
jgi:hypothetical protein